MSTSNTNPQSAPTDQTPWTIKRLLDWTTDFFKSKELESARLSAEILLAEAMNCPRIQLYTQFDLVPQELVLANYRDWVKRHAKGEPVAYLVGHKEFFSLKFNVDSNVLIPRPETEHVILAAIEASKNIEASPLRIVDIGTGSGCIAVTLAKHIENSEIVGIDISSDAIHVAQSNVELHDTQNVSLIQSDLFENLPPEFEPNLIVSNPPYIGRDEIETVDTSVKDFEPNVALFSGDDGMDVIRRLISESLTRLSTGGYLIFETSPIIFDECLKLVLDSAGFEKPQTIKDYSNHKRVVCATRK